MGDRSPVNLRHDKGRMFDLSVLMPYFFTMFVFLGGGCIFALAVAFAVFWFGVGMFYRVPLAPAVPDVSEGQERHYKSRSAVAHSSRFPDFASDDYNSALMIIERSPAELFPPNKVLIRCGDCRERIPAGEGYSHYNIGTRKFFCRSCHLSKGLPLRSTDDEKKDTAGEQGKNEV